MLRIPESGRPGVEKLTGLSADELDEVSEALEKGEPHLEIGDYVASVPDVQSVTKDEIKDILTVLFNIHAVHDDLRKTVDTVTDEFMRAISRLKLAVKDEKAVANFINRCLRSHGPFGITAKAAKILSEHSHDYLGSRILSDVRPIFSTEPDREMLAALIVHNLRFNYHDGELHRDFYIALDSKQLDELEMAIKRAKAKASLMIDSFGPHVKILEA